MARNTRGFENLCRLVTADQMARPKTEPAGGGNSSPPPGDEFSLRMLNELALEHSDGIVFLTSDTVLARFLRPHLSPDSLYLEYFPGDSARSRNLCRRLVDLAGELGLRGAASNRVHFLEAKDRDLHQVLSAIRLRKTVASLTEGDCVPDSCTFVSQETMAQ